MPTSAGAIRGRAGTAPGTIGGGVTHHAVFQPWAVLAEHAAARYRHEIEQALAAEQAELGEAGTLVDAARDAAKATAGMLRSVAWSQFSHYMSLADAAETAALAPAIRTLEARAAQAHMRFSEAITAAEKTYKQALADADRAKNDAAAIRPAG